MSIHIQEACPTLWPITEGQTSQKMLKKSNIWLLSTNKCRGHWKKRKHATWFYKLHIHTLSRCFFQCFWCFSFLSLCLTLCIFQCVCVRVCAQSGQQGFAVAWSSLATKGCQGSLTYQSKPKMCGRFHGSHYNS